MIDHDDTTFMSKVLVDDLNSTPGFNGEELGLEMYFIALYLGESIGDTFKQGTVKNLLNFTAQGVVETFDGEEKTREYRPIDVYDCTDEYH